ncbi:hypothetical protein Syun_000927 [Stephania yunnanensis]|uniref:Uncharacterized protein n=1 Tax=Stephania yunnanensis TaxID=152371 RepID=A0AAP0Q5S9_9MAGN
MQVEQATASALANNLLLSADAPLSDKGVWNQTSSYVMCGSREANEGKLEELSPPAAFVVVGQLKLAKLRFPPPLLNFTYYSNEAMQDRWPQYVEPRFHCFPKHAWVGEDCNGKQATFNIGQIPINNRSEWWGRRPPYFNGKGGIAVSQPPLYYYLSPNMITNEDRELRRLVPVTEKPDLTCKKIEMEYPEVDYNPHRVGLQFGFDQGMVVDTVLLISSAMRKIRIFEGAKGDLLVKRFLRSLFSFSSLPGKVDQRKVACFSPGLMAAYVVVDLPIGMPLWSKSQTRAGSKKTCAKDVFFSALSSQKAKGDAYDNAFSFLALCPTENSGCEREKLRKPYLSLPDKESVHGIVSPILSEPVPKLQLVFRDETLPDSTESRSDFPPQRINEKKEHLVSSAEGFEPIDGECSQRGGSHQTHYVDLSLMTKWIIDDQDDERPGTPVTEPLRTLNIPFG